MGQVRGDLCFTWRVAAWQLPHPATARPEAATLPVCPRVAHIHNLNGWKLAERKVEMPIKSSGSEADEWPHGKSSFVQFHSQLGRAYEFRRIVGTAWQQPKYRLP